MGDVKTAAMGAPLRNIKLGVSVFFTLNTSG